MLSFELLNIFFRSLNVYFCGRHCHSNHCGENVGERKGVFLHQMPNLHRCTGMNVVDNEPLYIQVSSLCLLVITDENHSVFMLMLHADVEYYFLRPLAEPVSAQGMPLSPSCLHSCLSVAADGGHSAVMLASLQADVEQYFSLPKPTHCTNEACNSTTFTSSNEKGM